VVSITYARGCHQKVPVHATNRWHPINRVDVISITYIGWLIGMLMAIHLGMTNTKTKRHGLKVKTGLPGTPKP
jgi:hypothetical protein